MSEVVLIDLNDKEIGTCEKMKAHQQALLHRAFSVFVYHDQKLCIQKRALNKYHCPGLWTNTCCSHPNKNESYHDAAKRRLFEECGIMCEVEEIFHFTYFAPFSNGLYEYERDHVFVADYDGEIKIDPKEIEEIKWIDFSDLLEDVRIHPQAYTPWFIIALDKVIERIK